MLVASVGAWLFAGMAMGLFPLMARSAAISFLGGSQEGLLGLWFGRYMGAFLLGAAAGGLLLGWWGDRFGRVQALGLSVLCYSLLTGAGAWARTPTELLVLRFFACMGIGGVWPNGIALASEAWSEASRPTLAGLFGTAINIGIVLVALLALAYPVTPTTWRSMMLWCAAPAPLGFWILARVPESPQWLALQQTPARQRPDPVRLLEVFRPPYLRVTIIGAILGTIPVFGNWSSGNWLIPWSDQAAQRAAEQRGADANADPSRKAWTQLSRSSGAVLGGLIGGWMAAWLGRRLTYFLISMGSLALSVYIFGRLDPLEPAFLGWVFGLGFVTTIYFGWLPLCLPELFPVRVRAAGSGVTFNFGRIAAAIGVLGAGELLAMVGGYRQVLALTSSIYALGLIVIWFAPDTSSQRLGTND